VSKLNHSLNHKINSLNIFRRSLLSQASLLGLRPDIADEAMLKASDGGRLRLLILISLNQQPGILDGFAIIAAQ
jgi:hypothetical protein